MRNPILRLLKSSNNSAQDNAQLTTAAMVHQESKEAVDTKLGRHAVRSNNIRPSSGWRRNRLETKLPSCTLNGTSARMPLSRIRAEVVLCEHASSSSCSLHPASACRRLSGAFQRQRSPGISAGARPTGCRAKAACRIASFACAPYPWQDAFPAVRLAAAARYAGAALPLRRAHGLWPQPAMEADRLCARLRGRVSAPAGRGALCR